MKILDSQFDRVALISLNRHEKRREQALIALEEQGLSEQCLIVDAWPGNELPPPAWWKAGGGAWGCLQSHVRALSEAWQAGCESVLVLEDDCCWQDRAGEMLGEFFEQLPGDWDQIYLGGVHMQEPEPLVNRPAVLRGESVNRTHAYAVRRGVIPRMLQHVLYAPDYIEADYAPHIDHQLEVAHRRRDWRVYTPSWWIAGQEENDSNINGRWHPRKWWHPSGQNKEGELPFIIVDEDLGDAERFLHRGWDFESDGTTPKDLGVGWTTLGRLHGIMREIAGEAYSMQKLPALAPPHRAGREAILKGWAEERVHLLSKVRKNLEEMCDYPWNGLFEHPWLSPRNGG